MLYNDFRDRCHSTSKACGWWPQDEPRRLKIPTTIALIHTEITEAHSFWEVEGPDDHLRHHDGLAVELADIVIRTADNAGAMKVDLSSAVGLVLHEFGTSRLTGDYLWENPICGRYVDLSGAFVFLLLHTFAADATEAFRRGEEVAYAKALGRIMVLCEAIAYQKGYDLYDVAREKIEYNRNRADHKPEARAKNGGKII